MTCINVTVEYFKELFREFPYMPNYVAGKAYFEDDIVYYNKNFYKSLSDGNLTEPNDSDNWILINESKDNYIQDIDIKNSFDEAGVNFNPNLFSNYTDARLVFCYLAAHYLVIDLNNAQHAFALGLIGFTQSKSVGSVSESYGIPQWMLNNEMLSPYAQTGYGRKYLSLIRPYLVGNIIFTPGAINFG